MDDIFKKTSNDIISKKVIDVFEIKSDNDVLAPRSDGLDVFETREDIFENPGYQPNIFPGDKETEYQEPTVKKKTTTGKCTNQNKPLQKIPKEQMSCQGYTEDTGTLYEGDDKNMKKKPTAVKPKRVTIKDDLECSEMYLDLIMKFNNDIEFEETNKFSEEEDLRTLNVDQLMNRLEKSLSVSIDKVEKMLDRHLEASDIVRLCHIGIEIANAKCRNNMSLSSAESDDSSPNETQSDENTANTPIQSSIPIDLKRRIREIEYSSHTGNRAPNYDYKVQNAVDLSKLFLETRMAHYKGFDESCDSSALLGIIVSIDMFPAVVQIAAKDVRLEIRNRWAHCDFTEWNSERINYLEDTTLGLELVNDIRQQIKSIMEVETVIWKSADREFSTVYTTLTEIGKTLNQHDKRISSLENTVATQGKTLMEYGSSYDADIPEIERWKQNSKDFIKTDIYKDILGIIKGQPLHTFDEEYQEWKDTDCTEYSIAAYVKKRDGETSTACKGSGKQTSLANGADVNAQNRSGVLKCPSNLRKRDGQCNGAVTKKNLKELQTEQNERLNISGCLETKQQKQKQNKKLTLPEIGCSLDGHLYMKHACVET
ncbi:unnamed protein product [Mytilus edulis]|uniref:Uncharacterized protein n=1 Tax=Mytilus edulis TaxID=6550 RepID=A0A8S3ULM3_MYTED|nr:unnamed protein product [Mytilus edulis]